LDVSNLASNWFLVGVAKRWRMNRFWRWALPWRDLEVGWSGAFSDHDWKLQIDVNIDELNFIFCECSHIYYIYVYIYCVIMSKMNYMYVSSFAMMSLYNEIDLNYWLSGYVRCFCYIPDCLHSWYSSMPSWQNP
jgi:hypothetical protein